MRLDTRPMFEGLADEYPCFQLRPVPAESRPARDRLVE
jgi:hypothetical protein